ncbi:MAG: glycosyltransferase family 2 protein [Bacteroidales bacterium]|nr:glycosyltransferase family 2 protein [Bacteroidales bacterium]
MLLSIVIPVFNMEEYLPRCLRSCMAQGPGTQIVVVNDGSTDASLQIAEEMLREWPESRIISQENQGLSAARNAGLEAAS